MNLILGAAGLLGLVSGNHATPKQVTSPMYPFGTTFPMTGSQPVSGATWDGNAYLGTNLLFNPGYYFSYTNSYYVPKYAPLAPATGTTATTPGSTTTTTVNTGGTTTATGGTTTSNGGTVSTTGGTTTTNSGVTTTTGGTTTIVGGTTTIVTSTGTTTTTGGTTTIVGGITTTNGNTTSNTGGTTFFTGGTATTVTTTTTTTTSTTTNTNTNTNTNTGTTTTIGGTSTTTTSTGTTSTNTGGTSNGSGTTANGGTTTTTTTGTTGTTGSGTTNTGTSTTWPSPPTAAPPNAAAIALVGTDCQVPGKPCNQVPGLYCQLLLGYNPYQVGKCQIDAGNYGGSGSVSGVSQWLTNKGGSCTHPSVCGYQSLTGSCWCDSKCAATGDCCSDFLSACPSFRPAAPTPVYIPPTPPPTLPPTSPLTFETATPAQRGDCTGQCGKEVFHTSGACFCDPSCAKYGDCCWNFVRVCGG